MRVISISESSCESDSMSASSTASIQEPQPSSRHRPPPQLVSSGSRPPVVRAKSGKYFKLHYFFLITHTFYYFSLFICEILSFARIPASQNFQKTGTFIWQARQPRLTKNCRSRSSNTPPNFLVPNSIMA